MKNEFFLDPKLVGISKREIKPFLDYVTVINILREDKLKYDFVSMVNSNSE